MLEITGFQSEYEGTKGRETMGRVVTLTGQDRLDFGFRKTCVSMPNPVREKARVPRLRIRKIEAIPVVQKKLRVAAYCRVSTLLETQEGSIRS